jgi:hypothetical protein
MQIKKLFVGCLALALFAATAPVFAQYYQYDYGCRFGNCQPIETIAVSASPNTPAGGYVVSGSLQNLGVFRIRANNGAVRVTKISAAINGGPDAEGTIESVAVYNNAGNRISNEVSRLNSPSWDNNPSIQNFTMDITIPANSYADLYIKGITDGITGPNPAYLYVQLATVNGTSITAIGQRSGSQITSSSRLALPQISILLYRSQPPSVTVNSAVRASAILRYYRDYTFSSRSEDQTLKGLTITADNINTRIMVVSFIIDNQLVLSKVADPYIGADTITLSSSERKIIAKGDRSLRIVIYASGVSSFRGNISTTGSSSGSSYSIPFSVFLPDR